MKKIILFSIFLFAFSNVYCDVVINEQKRILDHNGGANVGFQRVDVGPWVYSDNGGIKSRLIQCFGNGQFSCNGGSIAIGNSNIPESIVGFYNSLSADIIEFINGGDEEGSLSYNVYCAANGLTYTIIAAWETNTSGEIVINSSIDDNL